jgi:uncharacterized membrane protein YjdF
MNKKRDYEKIIRNILFAILIFSIGYSIYKIATVPVIVDDPEIYTHVKSDYVLMLLQCMLGLVVMFLPSFLENKLKFNIPNYMAILYFIFLYCAIYLGEVRSFYYLVPHWDTVLHVFSGAMLGAFGYILVTELNESINTTVNLSPFFVALFAFSFALSVGAIWEIYEFLGDVLFGLNMQKYRLENGRLLVGREALKDTMKDLIIDSLSALAVVLIGYSGVKLKIEKKVEEIKGEIDANR